MPDREWAGVVAALAAAVHDGWRAGATALWAVHRRREAVWLRAEHRAAAAALLDAQSGNYWDVVGTVARCRRMAALSTAHPVLAAPWRDAARTLAVAARLDQPARFRPARTDPARADRRRAAARV
jgi:ethanolamine utilization protein EutA (predicted chaperonin)